VRRLSQRAERVAEHALAERTGGADGCGAGGYQCPETRAKLPVSQLSVHPTGERRVRRRNSITSLHEKPCPTLSSSWQPSAASRGRFRRVVRDPGGGLQTQFASPPSVHFPGPRLPWSKLPHKRSPRLLGISYLRRTRGANLPHGDDPSHPRGARVHACRVASHRDFSSPRAAKCQHDCRHSTRGRVRHGLTGPATTRRRFVRCRAAWAATG